MSFDPVADLGATPVDEFDPVADLGATPVADPALERRASIGGAVKADPDRAARAAQVARQTGLPIGVVERNVEYVEQRRRAAEIEAQVAQSPAVAGIMSDPQTARIAHDDVEQLGVIEQGIGYVVNGARAVASAIPSINRSAWNWLRAGAEVANLPSVADFAKQYAHQQQQVEQSWMPDADNWVERSVYGGLQSAGQIALTLPLGVAGGGSRAVLTGVGAVEAGRSYGDARDKGRGIVPSLGFAAAQATAEIVTEAIPVGRLLADIGARSGFVPMILRQMAAEIPGEQVATLWQDFNEWLMVSPDKTLGDFARERPGRAAETLVSTIVAVGATTGSVAAAQRVGDREAQRAQVQANGAALGESIAAAAQSKLNERDASLLARFANEAAGDESIFIDANTFAQAAQAAGVDLATVAQVVPSLAEQLAQAEATGADVEISVGDAMAYLQPLASTLVEHARIGSPEAPTIAESYSQTERGAEVAQELAGVAVQDAQSVASTVEAATLQDRIEADINAAGRFTGEVATQYASVSAAFYTATAQRLGVDPQAFYSEFGARVVSSIGNVPTLDQSRRGAYDPASRTIALLQSADLSTFLHESGHHYLEVLDAVADRAPPIAADLDTIMASFGITREQWSSMDLEARRAYHETFARSFESYLFEGKAPSVELQGVFSRLRSWLLAVYKSLASLDVELSPEIREVFDRMLATDEQIAARTTPALDLSGLIDPAEQATYQALQAEGTVEAVNDLQGKALRDMGRTRRAHGREMKRIAATLADARAQIEAEVSLEVGQEPVFAARAALAAAPAEGKLSTKMLAELYGSPESVYGRFDWSPVVHLAAEAGQHPDIVAESFGFQSGDQLVRALVLAGDPAPHVESLVDQRMLERFGELTDPEGVARAADAAVANDHRSRVLLMAANALRRATGAKPILQGQARDAARAGLAGRKVRTIKPGQFRMAEAKAQRLAADAQSRGRIAEAARYARDALLAHAYHREALRIVEESTKARTYLSKFNSAGVRENLSTDYLGQIDQILAKLDLRKATDKEVARWSSLADWVKAQEEAGLAPNIDAELIDRAMRQPLRDLTVEQMRGLVDTVKQIEHLARLKQKLLTARDERTFDAVADELAATIREHGGKAKPVEADRSPTDRTVGKVREFFAGHRKFASLARQMDGGADAGPLWRALVRPMNDAGNAEAAMRAEATARLTAILKPIEALPGGMGQKVHIAEVGRSFSRQARLALALNMGNEANRSRVMLGENLTASQLQAVVGTLTAVEWRAVQELWSYLDSYWPSIVDKEMRVSGTAPERVQATPFAIKSADGVEMQLSGGYYPIAFDPLRSDQAQSHAAGADAKEMMQAAYTRSTTRRGHTKARAEKVAIAVEHSLQPIFRHLTQVTHDLTHHEWLIDATRLLRDERVAGAIREHYGPEVLKSMRDTVRDVAVGDTADINAADRVIARMRRNTTAAVMGWSMTTSLLQPFGLAQSMVRIGPRWVLKGAARWAGDAAHMRNSMRWVGEKSSFMKLRNRTFLREMNEVSQRIVGGASSKAQAFDAAKFIFMQKMQLVADIPTWIGAHEKALAEGRPEVDAVALADQAVLDSQGGGTVKDLAGVQRGGELAKALSMFYSYFSTTWNLLAEETAKVDGRSALSIAKYTANVMLLTTIPALLPSMITEALKGGDDWDDPEKLIEWQLSYLLGLLVVVRELGALAQGFDYRGPAAFRPVVDFGNLVAQIKQGEADGPAIRAVISAMGSALGIPSTQINRSIRGWEAFMEGDAPASSILFGPPPKD